MIRWTLFGLIVAALLAGVGYALWLYAPDPARHQVDFGRIEHTPLPDHVPASFLEEVRALGGFPAMLDTRDADLPARLGEAFGRHPWVDKVERVRRGSPGEIEVELTFRTPVANGTFQGRRFLLDRQGVILPPVRGLAAQLLEIRGATNAPAGLPGQRWGDPAVETAAAVAAEIGSQRDRLRLVAILIGGDRLRPDLRLETGKGTQVIWRTLNGRPDSSVDAKLKMLHDYCREHGSLDQPAGPYLLDVRSTTGLLRQPLKQ